MGLVADNSACGYYRIILPLHMLRMMGASVNYTSFQQGDAFGKYDIILSPRQHNPEVMEVLRHATWEGKLWVYEIDDDLHHVEPSNPAYTVYHQGTEECRLIPEFLKRAHGWTTTTSEIAKLYYQHNRNPVVISNFIDYTFRDWGVDVQWEGGRPVFHPRPIQKPAEWEGKIVIGFSGGTTHTEDLEQVGPAIRPILMSNPNVILAFYSSWEAYKNFIQKFNIPPERTSYVKARHFMDYPAGLHGFDIALAPLTCNQFNLCKSDLRCLESSAVGAAVVASNVGPYARFEARHPGQILLVGQGPGHYSTWTQALQKLIDDEPLRTRMQQQGRQLMMDEYSLEQNVHRWPLAWAAIGEQRELGNLGPDPDRKQRDKSWYMSYGKTGRNEPCPCGSGQSYSKCHPQAWG